MDTRGIGSPREVTIEASSPAVGGGVRLVLFTACRLAAKNKAPAIGTDLVLTSMLRWVPGLGAVLGFPRSSDHEGDASRSGTSQRLAWPSEGPESTREALRVLREQHWKAFGLPGRWRGQPAPRWEEEAVVALRLAIAAAAAQRLPLVGNSHLFAALLADPGNRASRLVNSRGINRAMLDEAARRVWPVADQDRPPSIAGYLRQCGVLVDPVQPPPTKRKSSLTARLMTLLAQASPALVGLEQEATAEAVRLGHSCVTPLHLVLSVLLLEDQMLVTGLRPAPAEAAANAVLLNDFLIAHPPALDVAEAIGAQGVPVEPQRRRSWRTNPRNPPFTVAAARAADKARQLAAAAGTPAGCLHLVHAVLTDPDDSGRQLIRALSADPSAVLSETTRRLNETGKAQAQ